MGSSHTTIKNKTYNYDRMVITGMDPKVHRALANIAKNLGNIPLASFLKPKLREIMDSYPLDMRGDPDNE